MARYNKERERESTPTPPRFRDSLCLEFFKDLSAPETRWLTISLPEVAVSRRERRKTAEPTHTGVRLTQTLTALLKNTRK